MYPTEPLALDKWLRKDPDFFSAFNKEREGGSRKKERLNWGPLEIGKAYYFENPDSNR